jgi:hypothetical protein
MKIVLTEKDLRDLFSGKTIKKQQNTEVLDGTFIETAEIELEEIEFDLIWEILAEIQEDQVYDDEDSEDSTW